MSLSNLQVLNAVLYMAEQGLQVARSSETIWPLAHNLYAHESLVESGVQDRVFEKLQVEQIVRIKLEAVCLDSTSIEVHPDGTDALKKRTSGQRQVSRGLEHQGSYGCRKCSNGIAFALSPGNTHDVPEGRQLLWDLPRMPEACPC